ncbi:MAG TPA: ATP-binding protein, partial [Cyclobacteriaceae bacterium]|nr:ATP-binding protein [Cyclobacteriaceae bacterium]
LGKTVPDNRLNEIKKLTTATIHELRKTVWLINKQSATVEEFVIKLREYIPAATTPALQLTATGNLQILIPSVKANELFRIIQEAVNNAIKHAEATQLQIALHVTDRVLSVKIIDDGVGFDTQSPTGGFGLRNINKRIKSVNGTVSINSTPAGTTLQLFIPV